MASRHSIHSYSDSRIVAPAGRSNVVHFPNQRATLSVTIECVGRDNGQAQLRALFHSALGIYVVDAFVQKGLITVRLDIAMNDVEFTLHNLIKDLPEAVIGRLEPKRYPQSDPDVRGSGALQLN